MQRTAVVVRSLLGLRHAAALSWSLNSCRRRLQRPGKQRVHRLPLLGRDLECRSAVAAYTSHRHDRMSWGAARRATGSCTNCTDRRQALLERCSIKTALTHHSFLYLLQFQEQVILRAWHGLAAAMTAQYYFEGVTKTSMSSLTRHEAGPGMKRVYRGVQPP
jgi:hypothetical protein